MAIGGRKGRIVAGHSPEYGDRQYTLSQVTHGCSRTPVPRLLDQLPSEVTKQQDERLEKPCFSRSPDEIRAGITLVFFSLLHGCYEGFPL